MNIFFILSFFSVTCSVKNVMTQNLQYCSSFILIAFSTLTGPIISLSSIVAQNITQTSQCSTKYSFALIDKKMRIEAALSKLVSVCVYNEMENQPKAESPNKFSLFSDASVIVTLSELKCYIKKKKQKKDTLSFFIIYVAR